MNHDAPLECCIIFSTESFACLCFMMFRCVKLVYDTLFSNKTNIKNILIQRGNRERFHQEQKHLDLHIDDVPEE